MQKIILCCIFLTSFAIASDSSSDDDSSDNTSSQNNQNNNKNTSKPQNGLNLGALLNTDPGTAQNQIQQIIDGLQEVQNYIQNHPYTNKKALALGFTFIKQAIDGGLIQGNVDDIDSFIAGIKLYKIAVLQPTNGTSNNSCNKKTCYKTVCNVKQIPQQTTCCKVVQKRVCS